MMMKKSRERNDGKEINTLNHKFECLVNNSNNNDNNKNQRMEKHVYKRYHYCHAKLFPFNPISNLLHYKNNNKLLSKVTS